MTFRRLTSKLTGPEQRDGICASVFASANTGTLCRVRLSDLLGLSLARPRIGLVTGTMERMPRPSTKPCHAQP